MTYFAHHNRKRAIFYEAIVLNIYLKFKMTDSTGQNCQGPINLFTANSTYRIYFRIAEYENIQNLTDIVRTCLLFLRPRTLKYQTNYDVKGLNTLLSPTE